MIQVLDLSLWQQREVVLKIDSVQEPVVVFWCQSWSRGADAVRTHYLLRRDGDRQALTNSEIDFSVHRNHGNASMLMYSLVARFNERPRCFCSFNSSRSFIPSGF